MRVVIGLLICVVGWFIEVLIFAKMREVEDNPEAERAYSIIWILVGIAIMVIAHKVSGIPIGD